MDRKKLKHGIITATLAAGMITNAAADDPAALLQSPDEAADDHVQVLSAGEMPEYAVYLNELEELTGFDRVRDFVMRLPVAVRAVFLLPLWAVGEVAFAVASAFSAALATPAGTFIAGIVAQLAILVAVFALAAKVISPHTPVREILGRKRFPWLVAGAVAVSAANLALEQVWDDWNVVRIVLMTAVGYLVLAFLWHRVCDFFRAPFRRRKKLEYTYE